MILLFKISKRSSVLNPGTDLCIIYVYKLLSQTLTPVLKASNIFISNRDTHSNNEIMKSGSISCTHNKTNITAAALGVLQDKNGEPWRLICSSAQIQRISGFVDLYWKTEDPGSPICKINFGSCLLLPCL